MPVAVFLHVFLAYPSGRLERWFERALVVDRVRHRDRPRAAADDARRLRRRQPARGRRRGLRGRARVPRPAHHAQRVRTDGRRDPHRPAPSRGWSLRRWRALLIDSFALVLVMLAFLLMSAVFGEYGFVTIQRITLFAVGLAPAAFLLGLLDARLARSAAGDLFVELQRRSGAGRSARRPGPRPARSVAHARLLAARVRDLRGSGRPARRGPGRGSAAGDDGHRAGWRTGGGAGSRPRAPRRARSARCGHRGGGHRPGERAAPRRAAGQAGGAAGVARPGHRGRTERAPAAGAEPARRRAAASRRALARARPARGAARHRPRGAPRASMSPGARSPPPSRSCARSPGASTRPSSAGMGWRSPSSSSRPARPSRSS